MAAPVFPASPTNGQAHPHEGRVWTWNATANRWELASSDYPTSGMQIIEYDVDTGWPARSTHSLSLPVIFINRVNATEPVDPVDGLDLLVKKVIA